jgi:hypothetical protein
MLRNGPQVCHASVLALLHSFLLHTCSKKGVLGDADQRQKLITATAQLLKGNLWTEATRVLDVAVRGSRKSNLSNSSDETMSPTSVLRDIESSDLPLLANGIGQGTIKCIDLVRGVLKRAEKQEEKKKLTSAELLRLFDDNKKANSPRHVQEEMLDEFEFTSTGIDSDDETTSDSDLITDNFTDTHTETDLASSRFNVAQEEGDEDMRLFEDRMIDLLKSVKLVTAYPTI